MKYLNATAIHKTTRLSSRRVVQSLWLLSSLVAAGGLVAVQAQAAESADKISDKISAETGEKTQRYIVRLNRHESSLMRKAASEVSETGGKVRFELPELDAIAVEMNPEQRDRMIASSDVAAVEVDPPRFMLAQRVPYGIPAVQSDQVPYGPAPGIKVCVVDSGFDLGHPDLPGGGRVTGQAGPGTGNWFEDGTGHGTHVAGSIMALANSVGVIGATNGGNYDIHIYKVFPDESEPVSSSDVIAGVQACVDQGARVVNLSLGCTGQGCFSRTEEAAFARFEEAGVLVVAAAGNDGLDASLGTEPSYPAAYDSVIAVAAVDESLQRAGFSQRYPEVELAAPGVEVLSTVPRGTVSGSDVVVAAQAFDSNVLDGSPAGTVSAPLVDCGIGDTVCSNVSGAVCLIERGTVLFSEKALNCQNGGGIGAIIYNNVPGSFLGTLGAESGVTIPVSGVSDTDGATMVTLLGQNASVAIGPQDYGVRSGTSMATPHVTGVAALVWSQDPSQTSAQIRAALQAGARDLGDPGRDTSFGFGLVQAASAVAQLSGDSDGDGVLNTFDNCPLAVNGDQLDSDADGQGDPCDNDIDGDGISNDYESTHSLNPNFADGLGDQDGDGFSNLAEFYAASSSSDSSSVPQDEAPASLVAAVLPTSRSAQVGSAVTAFATVINTSSEIGVNCSIAPFAPLTSSYQYFSTSAATNAVDGAANQVRNIAPGEAASFLLRFVPDASIAPQEVGLRFGCDNLGQATQVDGLNTLLLSASTAPVADVVALAATVSGDGVLRTEPGGAGAFGVASVNLGATSQVTVTAQGTNPNVPVDATVCPTDASGNCLTPAASSISVNIATSATPTFSVFVQVGQLTTFDPALTRMRVTFTDASGAVRGATSVALFREQ